MPFPVLLRTQSDDRLVGLARAGHERAFEAIVERYRGPLLRAARRYLPEARAEDAVQQAFIAAWNALGRGDDVRDLRAWLFRIVHNTALNQLAAAGYDYAELPDLAAGEGPQDHVERRADVRQALSGLSALPERQRDALLRIAVEGRTQEEVARELGVTEGAVRQLVHRARLTLRAAVTAVVPLPVATWAAGAGGGGGAVAGAAAVLATTAVVAVPTFVGDDPDPVPRAQRPAIERRATPTPTVAPRRTATPAGPSEPRRAARRRSRTRTATPPRRTPAPQPTAEAPRRERATPTPPRRAQPTPAAPRREEATPTAPRREESTPEAPPPEPTPAATAPPPQPTPSDNSGPGSANSGPGSSGDGAGSSGSNSGPGSGSSGSGSGSSGSGSSGSGSSGSGSSGHGSGDN